MEEGRGTRMMLNEKWPFMDNEMCDRILRSRPMSTRLLLRWVRDCTKAVEDGFGVPCFPKPPVDAKDINYSRERIRLPF